MTLYQRFPPRNWQRELFDAVIDEKIFAFDRIIRRIHVKPELKRITEWIEYEDPFHRAAESKQYCTIHAWAQRGEGERGVYTPF